MGIEVSNDQWAAATRAGAQLREQSAAPSGGGPWPAPVEATGQQLCYDPSGLTTDVIPCAGTGQDGEAQLGVASPTPRFTDNLDGSVTDNLTGLIWLQAALCLPSQDWESALVSPGTLAVGSCGLSDGSQAGDWRLPNITELLSLVDRSQTGGPLLPTGHPFDLGPRPFDFYWSSTSFAEDPSEAWLFIGTNFAKDRDDFYVWPVRGGAGFASRLVTNMRSVPI